MKLGKSALLVTTSMFGCLAYGVATAQEAKPAPAPEATAPSDQLEVLVVTAQKRQELVTKAPVAVSVVKQSGLDAQGVTAVSGLVGTVPALQFSSNGFSMRGIGSSNYTDQSFSTVAVQIDGVYERRPQGLELGLYDVGQIEVVRGPQGTVYGKNATAGVVNINTADPKSRFEAGGDVAYGSQNDITVRAYVNAPVSDTLSVRGSFVRRKNDGYDAAGGGRRNYGATNATAARMTALWSPTDSFDWRLSLSYGENKGTVPQSKTVGYFHYPNANLATGALGERAYVSLDHSILLEPGSQDNGLNDHQTAVRSRMTWRINDKLTLNYIAGYSNFKNGDIIPSTPLFTFQNDTRTRSSSHELNLNYETDRVKFVAGAYHYSDKIDGFALLHIQNVVPHPFNVTVNNVAPTYVGVGTEPSAMGVVDILAHELGYYSSSTAYFGQLTYNLTDRLRLTGGVRSTHDAFRSDHQYDQFCAYGTATAINPQLSCGVPFGPQQDVGLVRTSSSNVSWKASVDYDIAEDVLGYVTIATGYRGGGVGDHTSPVQYQTFAPETVTNYEAGIRSLWLNRRLSLNLTAYDMEYKDLQVTIIGQALNGQPTPFTANAAAATIRGAEFEAAWRPTPQDTISGFVNYLDASFASFPNASDSLNAPATIYNGLAPAFGFATIPTPVADYSGNALPNAPKFSLSGRYQHKFTFASGATLTPSAIVYWQSKSYPDASNASFSVRNSYSKTDLNLIYADKDDHLNIGLYVYNLEDKRVMMSGGASWATVTQTSLPPRTYGIRIGYKY